MPKQCLSNARVESINNKIKLSIRKAYGFRNYENMVDMIMLVCSKLSIPLPNRGVLGMQGVNVHNFLFLPIDMHDDSNVTMNSIYE